MMQKDAGIFLVAAPVLIMPGTNNKQWPASSLPNMNGMLIIISG